MKFCRYITVPMLVTIILLTACNSSQNIDRQLSPGLFATGNAPAFAPPGKGQVIAAHAVAIAVNDAGVERLPLIPAAGVMAVAEPLVAINKKNSVRQHLSPTSALALAMGDSLMGKRAFMIITAEQFGAITGELAQCALWGSNAGVVIMVLNDSAGRFSSAQVSGALLARATQLPNRNSDLSDIYMEVHDAFLTSEKYQLPFIMMVEIDELTKPVTYSRVALSRPNSNYERDIKSHILSPALSNYQKLMLNAKQTGNMNRTIDPPEMPVMPKDLPVRFKRNFELYRPAMATLSKMRSEIKFVAAEGQSLGFFAFEPFNIVDSVGFSGSAIQMAARAAQNGRTPAFAIMNEHDFLRYASNGVASAKAEYAPVKVIVFNMGIPEVAGATPVAQNEFDAQAAAFPNVTRISYETSKEEFKTIIQKIANSDSIELLVIDYK